MYLSTFVSVLFHFFIRSCVSKPTTLPEHGLNDLTKDARQPTSLGKNYTYHNGSTDSSHFAVSIIVSGESKDSILHLNSLSDLAEMYKLCSATDKNILVTLQSNSMSSLNLKLQKNSVLLTKNFIWKYYSPDTGEPIISKAHENPHITSCYYFGEVIGHHHHSSASLSFSASKGVTGVMHFSNQEYSLQSVVNGSTVEHFLTKQQSTLADFKPMKCGTADFNNYTTSHHEFKRDVRMPAGSNMETRYIEMYIVADRSFYLLMDSVDAAVIRVVNIANYASILYRSLNIYIALVGVEIWSHTNKITYKMVNGSYVDSGDLLRNFNKYRQHNINYETHNDNAQLLSSEKFAGGIVGKGSTRGICTQADSAGVSNAGSTRSYIQTATTLAHELGHNLGFSHSDSDVYYGKDCGCPADDDPTFTDCIMHSSADPYQSPKKWSRCTQDSMRKLFDEEKRDYCLKNEPEKLYEIGNTPICGNMFVEEGEECDCGQPADCQSACCDPTTCRLFANATCATGPCCDINTCRLRPESYICRRAQGDCDLEELCSGKSEWCPEDTYKLNGIKCYNQADAYCYDGKCNSHNSQCNLIWADGARRSSDVCYQYYNKYTSFFGNCGWRTSHKKSATVSIDKVYLTCQTEEDRFCGLLHCDKNNPNNESPRVKAYPLLIYKQFITRPEPSGNCFISSFDVGYQAVDPGQVPNGAKCSENKMCSNSKCVDVPELPQECNCNGRGVCNQKMECHCDIGWAPPFCEDLGFGGSMTSNPSSIAGPRVRVIVGPGRSTSKTVTFRVPSTSRAIGPGRSTTSKMVTFRIPSTSHTVGLSHSTTSKTVTAKEPNTSHTLGLNHTIATNPPVVGEPNSSHTIGLVTFFGGVVPMLSILIVVAYIRREELIRLIQRLKGRYTKPRTAEVNGKKVPPPPSPEKVTKTKPPKNAVTTNRVTNKATISGPFLQHTTNKEASANNKSNLKAVRSTPAGATPAKPAPAKPAPTKPAPAKPAPTKPAPTKPAPNISGPIKPTPARPAPAAPPKPHTSAPNKGNNQMYENITPKMQDKKPVVPKKPTNIPGHPQVPPKPKPTKAQK